MDHLRQRDLFAQSEHEECILRGATAAARRTVERMVWQQWFHMQLRNISRQEREIAERRIHDVGDTAFGKDYRDWHSLHYGDRRFPSLAEYIRMYACDWRESRVY